MMNTVCPASAPSTNFSSQGCTISIISAKFKGEKMHAEFILKVLNIKECNEGKQLLSHEHQCHLVTHSSVSMFLLLPPRNAVLVFQIYTPGSPDHRNASQYSSQRVTTASHYKTAILKLFPTRLEQNFPVLSYQNKTRDINFFRQPRNR